MDRFEGKVALVTGAAAGIGRATAQRLASEACSVFIVDVAREGLEETAKLITEAGGTVEFATCDVSNEAEVKATVQACVDRFGRLDVLCNIAAILLLEHFDKIPVEKFRRVLEVNLVGTFMLCQAALPHLLETRGNIVNTSSTSALAGMPYGAAYGTSKGGVSALTRTLAVEFGKRGLRCNAINPGSIKTAMGSGDNLPKDSDMQLVMRAMPIDKPRGPEVIAGGHRDAGERGRRAHQRRRDSRRRGNALVSYTVEMAADLAEIQQKIYRYGWCIDHRTFDELDDLFTADAMVHYDVPGGTKLPWPEMKQWLPRGLQLFRVTQHNMSNPHVEFSGDTAHSTTYGHLIHVQHHKDDSTSMMRHHTIYTDDWVRQAGEWRVRARTLSNLFMDGPVFGPDKVHVYTTPKPF